MDGIDDDLPDLDALLDQAELGLLYNHLKYNFVFMYSNCFSKARKLTCLAANNKLLNNLATVYRLVLPHYIPNRIYSVPPCVFYPPPPVTVFTSHNTM